MPNCLREAGAGSSNLLTPTNEIKGLQLYPLAAVIASTATSTNLQEISQRD